jgi:membrane protein involved in colicin uptake
MVESFFAQEPVDNHFTRTDDVQQQTAEQWGQLQNHLHVTKQMIAAIKSTLSQTRGQLPQEEAGTAMSRNQLDSEQRRNTDEHSTFREEVRQSAEDMRDTAEEERERAEEQRMFAEDQRVKAEGERTTAETLRKEAEALRRATEELRATAEDLRQLQEEQRKAGEEQRQLAAEVRQALVELLEIVRKEKNRE